MSTIRPTSQAANRQRGFTLVELMVAVALGMLVMVALIAVYLNVSRTNSEMYKTNGMIENGRFAVDVLNEDLTHAGYWGGYVPQFDNYALRNVVPPDVPLQTELDRGPCYAYASWNADYRSMLIGIPVEVYGDAAPPGCDTATLLADRQPGTDVLVVRHAETCEPGATNCEAFNANKVYFQASQCANETDANVFYDLSKRAALADFTLKKRGCTGVPPATVAGALGVAEVRKLVSNIYYVRSWATAAGDGVPTLVRTSFGVSGGVPAHEPAQALIEGIEAFRVELGIDAATRCPVAAPAPVNYASAIRLSAPPYTSLVDPATCAYDAASATRNTLPTVRGDGIPESYVHCPAAGCTAAQLVNVVAAKIFLIARSRDRSPNYTDTKSYTLGSAGAASAADPAYKRHLFQTTVRMPNISARRETPAP